MHKYIFSFSFFNRVIFRQLVLYYRWLSKRIQTVKRSGWLLLNWNLKIMKMKGQGIYSSLGSFHKVFLCSSQVETFMLIFEGWASVNIQHLFQPHIPKMCNSKINNSKFVWYDIISKESCSIEIYIIDVCAQGFLTGIPDYLTQVILIFKV